VTMSEHELQLEKERAEEKDNMSKIYREQLSSFEEQLKMKEEIIINSEKELNAFKKSRAEELENHRNEYQSLEQKLEALQSSSNDLGQSRAKQDEEMKHKQKEYEDQLTLIQKEVESRNEMLRKKEEDFVQEKQEWEKERERAEKEYESLKISYNKATEARKKEANERKELEDERVGKAEYEMKSRECEELKGKIEELKNEMKQLRAEKVEGEQLKGEETKKLIDDLRTENTILSSSLSHIRSELASAKKYIDGQSSFISAAQSEVKLLKQASLRSIGKISSDEEGEESNEEEEEDDDESDDEGILISSTYKKCYDKLLQASKYISYQEKVLKYHDEQLKYYQELLKVKDYELLQMAENEAPSYLLCCWILNHLTILTNGLMESIQEERKLEDQEEREIRKEMEERKQHNAIGNHDPMIKEELLRNNEKEENEAETGDLLTKELLLPSEVEEVLTEDEISPAFSPAPVIASTTINPRLRSISSAASFQSFYTAAPLTSPIASSVIAKANSSVLSVAELQEHLDSLLSTLSIQRNVMKMILKNERNLLINLQEEIKEKDSECSSLLEELITVKLSYADTSSDIDKYKKRIIDLNKNKKNNNSSVQSLERSTDSR
jgi:hypothetical protein